MSTELEAWLDREAWRDRALAAEAIAAARLKINQDLRESLEHSRSLLEIAHTRLTAFAIVADGCSISRIRDYAEKALIDLGRPVEEPTPTPLLQVAPGTFIRATPGLVPKDPPEVPTIEETRPACKYCSWWKSDRMGEFCIKCGKHFHPDSV